MLTVSDNLTKRPWLLAFLWLCFLAPLFFISYNFANSWAASQPHVGQLVFDWERHIPFLPWTILPYWSIDLLYGLSLFVCTSKQQLHRLGKMLLTTQVIAVACFIAFPLHFSVERPPTSGLFGDLFVALTNFDLPYNQAPSLHIALLVILWLHFPRYLGTLLRWPFHVLCSLILISVLTTYQHHFIDVPTGALLGFFSVWLWPKDGRSMLLSGVKFTANNKETRQRLCGYYGVGALCFAGIALLVKGWALWLLWPSVSLLLVSWNYGFVGQRGFEKSDHGAISVAVKWLLWPYLIAAFVNSRLFTRKINRADCVVEGLWLGRFPQHQDLSDNGYVTVIDMTAEFSAPALPPSVTWHSIPNLDLLTPSLDNLRDAASLIENSRDNGDILVVCALGYSRSSCAVIAWLLLYNHSASVEEAVALVAKARPSIVLKEGAIKTLHKLHQCSVNRENANG